MFLNNKEIIQRINDKDLIISPFVGHEIRTNEETNSRVVSYGLNQNSYDIRLSHTELRIILPTKVRLNHPEPTQILHPFMDNPKEKRSVPLSDFIIPPHTMALGHSLEYFSIPKDITGFLYCKSTYARLGMNMAPTVLKSGWDGQLVLEIYNQTEYPLRVNPGEGIGTIYFGQHHPESDSEYRGEYRGQMGITLAK